MFRMNTPALPRFIPRPLPILGTGVVLCVVALTPVARAAMAVSDGPSRIQRVTVYPGSAVIERVARIPAGAREVVIPCLSAAFDMATLRLEAVEANVRLGPVTATTQPRASAPACNTNTLDARIQALEDRMAGLDAEIGARDLVLGQLKGDVTASGGKGSPAALASTLALVQRTGQDALTQQHRLRRQRTQIEQELAPLKAERDRQQGESEVRQLTVQLSAPAESELRLQYQIPGPTWAPAYRATLDTGARAVEMERQAQVSQSTGEDWSGVALRLSTGQPQAATAGPQPRPWQVSPRPPMVAEAMPMMAAAPAPMVRMAKAAPSPEAPPLDFAVQVTQGEFATTFDVPGKVDVRSGGQSVAFTLGQERWPATVRVQSVPQADTSAWVVAEVTRPEGVWPNGTLQLLRGNQTVGRTIWNAASGAQGDKIALSFGRDELVRVQRLPVPPFSETTGFISSRTERRVGHLYEVENRHRNPVELEVLESTPVPTDAQITVARKFDPAPQPGDWKEQPGIVAWRQTLTAGQKARFSAEYTIGHPKDLPVVERR